LASEGLPTPRIFTRYARRKWDRVFAAIGCIAAVTANYLAANMAQGSTGQRVSAYFALLLAAMGFAVPAGFIARSRWNVPDERKQLGLGDEAMEQTGERWERH